MKQEKAIFIKSFKTKRLDGHSVRTIYALTETGIVNIERRIISTELNDGFKLIRNFGKYVYQCETMVFKLASFIEISKNVGNNLHKLDFDKVIQLSNVSFSPNDKSKVLITTEL
jgi:hypothetical protein